MKLPEVETTIVVPFYDVDMMEVAWHGHYIKYLEVARCELLETIDYSYDQMKQSGYAWPVIEVKLRYVQPARFGQKIKVRARLVEYEIRLKIDYLISDAATDKRLTKAHSVQVAVDMEREELLLGSPAILYRKLGIEQ